MRTGPTSVGEGRPGPPCLPRRSQGLELSWARVGPGLSIPKSPQGPPTCREWRTTALRVFQPLVQAPPLGRTRGSPWGFTWSQVTGELGRGQAEHSSGRLLPIGHLVVPTSRPASEGTRSPPSKPSPPSFSKDPFHLLSLPIFGFNAES